MSDQPAERPQDESRPTSPAKAAAVVDEEIEPSQKFLFFNVVPSWMVSFITHVGLIILLALLVMPSTEERDVSLVASSSPNADLDTIDLNLDAMDFEMSDPLEQEMSEEIPVEMPMEVEEVSLPEATVDFGSIMAAEEFSMEEVDFGEMSISESDGETAARSEASKESNLKKYGGNAASEAAVALALKWIVDHQLDDGGWNFNHQLGKGNFRTSPDPGELIDARSGATAIALLPLLGNGQTHKVGKYKKQVQAGLEFLMRRAKKSGRGVSYIEPGGSMYSHGLAAIVFGEAFAMSRDPLLAPYAQGSIWFIEDVQDPVGGGWRYVPRQRGDTSAVGWQLMALKSAKLSGLDINPRTYQLAEKFLDNVSTPSGAFYGYTDPPPSGKVSRSYRARTAIGLLCRMYMGWDKGAPGMQEGIKWLDDMGPDIKEGTADMYYNYYATQTIKHYGGREWEQWNVKMRDFLIESQNKEGNAAGSWMVGSPKSHSVGKGGRLYETALACMTLEIYYRYLPLYGDSAADDEFKLD